MDPHQEALFVQTFNLPCTLIPLEIDDSDEDSVTWIPLQNPKHLRATDDGCEHYKHTDNGKHYVYDYHLKNEWREYGQQAKLENNMSLFNALIQLFKW